MSDLVQNIYFDEPSTVYGFVDDHFVRQSDFNDARKFINRLNCMLLDVFERSWLKSEGFETPTCLISDDSDGRVNMSYMNSDQTKSSCFYTVQPDGFTHVKEFNEVLNLSSLQHNTVVVGAILEDIYGINAEEAIDSYLNDLLPSTTV